MHSPRGRRNHHWTDDLNLLSVALLLVSLVCIVLALIGIVRDGSAAFWVFVPTALAVWNILTIRRR
jgi:hypothetical protein